MPSQRVVVTRRVKLARWDFSDVAEREAENVSSRSSCLVFGLIGAEAGG